MALIDRRRFVQQTALAVGTLYARPLKVLAGTHLFRGREQNAGPAAPVDAAAIETPTVCEPCAERIRLSTEQVILLIARWQRVPFVTGGGSKNAFELRLESMFGEEEEN
jgi:hypothetical protein